MERKFIKIQVYGSLYQYKKNFDGKFFFFNRKLIGNLVEVL